MKEKKKLYCICMQAKIYYQLKMDEKLMCDCSVQLICKEWISEVNLCML